MPNPSTPWTDHDSTAVNAIRILSADMVQRANSGHPGMPMGFAQPAHILWSRYLNVNPDNPFWPARDRFILSCGHGSALLYSLLHLMGFDLGIEDLKQFRQFGSRTPGHPEFGETPGVETTTGPLGQGVGNGVGMAMAQRYVRETLGVHEGGFDPLDHFIYVVASDGDLQEGVSAEACSLAGRQQLGRLIVLYDDNRISIDGGTDLAWSEDVCARYDAYGWQTLSVDGDDVPGLIDAIDAARTDLDRPTLIRIRTHIGYGSPSKQDSSSSHGAPLGEDELRVTRQAMGWEHAPFDIPDDVYSLYAEAGDRGRHMHESWLVEFEAWLNESPDRSGLWGHLMEGASGDYVADSLPLTFDPDASLATRQTSGVALNWLAERDPAVIGGCADLAGSVKTMIKEAGNFLPESPGGRNLFFGIREHAMGAIANGMALYGSIRPYTGTFLVFSDYMRPSIRLAALMKLPVIFVFSHDSIGVGEDGPTHQPIEHYAALRTIPNLHVYRPGDAEETVQAWKAAYDRTDGPTVILTSRQKWPVLDRTSKYAGSEGTTHGGYVIADVPDPRLILIATGSELWLALQARDRLIEEGIPTRVVSLPCWEAFSEQPREYQDRVLPPAEQARVSVEVGVSLGWERWVGSRGSCFSLEHFGASAPGARLFEEFGFTVDALVEHARSTFKASE